MAAGKPKRTKKEAICDASITRERFAELLGIRGVPIVFGNQQKPAKPYDEERRDKAAKELARELASANPNWTYAALLEKEVQHWQGRMDSRAENMHPLFRMLEGY